MKSITRYILFFFTSMLILSCSSTLNVSTDFDRRVDFSKYKSFTFYQLTDKGPGLSQLNQNRIVNAIKGELIKAGFIENSANPDLLINATAIVKERKEISATTNYYGYGGYYRPYYWGPSYMGPTTYNVNEYKDGSLIIDVVDASTRKLLWQGTGNKEIDVPLKNPDKEIPAAVTKIMSGFPPQASR